MASVRQQNREPAGPDDLPRCAAEDHLAPGRMAITAHDEEIGSVLARRREQQLADADAGERAHAVVPGDDAVPGEIGGELAVVRAVVVAGGQYMDLARLIEEGEGCRHRARRLDRAVPGDGDDLAD